MKSSPVLTALARLAHLSRRLPLDRWFAERIAAPGGVSPHGVALRRSIIRHQAGFLAAGLRRAAKDSAFYAQRLASGPEPLNALIPRLQKLAGAENPDEAELYGLLARLPFTRPEELAERPEAFLAVPHDRVEGLVSVPSSGSSGRLKRIFCTGADLALTAEFFCRGMRVMLEPETGERVAMLMSGDRPGSTGDLFGRAMSALGVPALVAGAPEDETGLTRRLLEFGPTCLVGHPAHLLALSRRPEAASLGRTVRSVLLTGDAVPEALARSVGLALEAAPFRHYGLTELGLGGAVECSEAAGCHLREPDFITELITPDGAVYTGSGASGPSPWGEIVITTLTREAMPLFRYRTGDLGRITGAPCACGSVLRRLEVLGRDSELLPPLDRQGLKEGEGYFAGGRVHAAELEARLCALPWLRSWRFAACRDAENGQSVVRLLVLLEPLPDILLPDEAAAKAGRDLRPLLSRLDQNAVRVYVGIEAPASLAKGLGGNRGKRRIVWTDPETFRLVAGTVKI